MPLIDQIEAKTLSLGLPVDRLKRITVPVGALRVTESRAGRLVRQLEDHYKIVNRAGPLGQRFARIPA